MKSRWLNKIITFSVISFIGLFAVNFYSGDAYAEEESKGSFSIYATQLDCSYYEDKLVVDPCPSHISKTAEVTLDSNGKYKIGRYDGAIKDSMPIKISDKKLTMEPQCAVFNNCGNKITIDLSDNITDTYNALNSALNGEKWNMKNNSIGSGYYTKTIYYFSAEDVTDPSKVPTAPGTTEPGTAGAGTGTATAGTCMGSAGTSLGWILCPALEALNGVTDWAYNELLKPALQIDPQLFTQESVNSSTNTSEATTRQAWDIFRNIANVLFIILLLVGIFSQLTGVGIDNYGIKKILPKLIVAAILINLSYWICIIFVDLSNILGNAFQTMFENLPPATDQLPAKVGEVELGQIAGGALTFVAVLGVLAGSIAAGVFAAGGAVAFLISVIVAAISAVVAIFFLFLLLAAREAAIVVLVVISPLAFACYMLPNTQNIFKKWWGLGWKLLLVFPIAGLLMGGGDYVSRLLLLSGAGSEGFFSAFAAILVGIVPIFFIPAVLKNSFAAMGNLGAKISGIGQKVGSRLSGNVDKSIRGSERFKNYQSDRDRQRKIESARRTAARYTDENGNIRQGLSARQQRRAAQALSIQLGEEQETRKRENLLNGGYAASMAGIEESARMQQSQDRTALMNREHGNEGLNELMAQWRAARDSGNAQDLEALTNVINTNYGARGANQIAAATGEIDENDANFDTMVHALRQTMRDNSSFATNLSKSGDAFDMISNNGVGEDGQRHGLAHFTRNMQGGSVSSVGDWANQGTATLRRAAESGALSREMMEDLLNSEDPTVQSKLQGDPDKRNVLQSALYNMDHPPAAVGPQPDEATAAGAYRAEQQAAADAAANTPTIIGGGAYKHNNNGNVVHLNQMSDGTFVDAQSGQVVDITHYKKH